MLFFETLLRDLRHSARIFVRHPAFTGTAILTLALGIGATSVMFSVFDAVLLKPLPYRDPDRRAMIWSRWKDFDKTWVSDAEVLDYRRRTSTLAAVAAWSPGQANLTGDGEPIRVGLARVTANTFSVLGVEPLLGRTFTEGEDRPNGPPVAILSHGIWQRRYGEDPGVLDRRIDIDGVSYTVLGVMPERFQLPTDYNVSAAEPTQLWVPLAIDEADLSRGSHGYYAAAELAPGATAETATAELRALTATLTREGVYHESMQFTAFAVSLEDEILGSVRPAVLLLLGAVAFLLLIACANVANLFLVAAEGRQREIAVRAALGAGGPRLARQLLSESLLVGLAAGALGLGLAYAGARVAGAVQPTVIPRAAEISIDSRIVLFTAALSLATTFIFSVVPAFRALRLDLVDSLKEGGGRATEGASRQRFRSSLVVVETALAVVLVIGAGLMIRSLQALQRIDLGFDPENVLTLRLSLPPATYDSSEKVVRFYRDLLERVRALPAVRRAGAIRALPLAVPIGDWGLDVEGYIETPGNNAKGDWQVASDGAVESLGERLVKGRSLAPTDTIDSQPVALVNESCARRYWGDTDPIGGRIRMGSSLADRPWATVVGVVADVRHNGVTGVIKEKFYMPHSQFHRSTGFAIPTMTLVVKADGNPLALVEPIRSEIRLMDRNLPLSAVRLMTDVVNDSIATTRLTGLLLGVLASLALTLAAIGIYGVVAYLVGQRFQEIGIRMAMGAAGRDVFRLILVRGLALSLTGIGAGVLTSLATARVMARLLHEVRPIDPVTFITVPVVLVVVALLASYIPARRATRIDPAIALRAE